MRYSVFAGEYVGVGRSMGGLEQDRGFGLLTSYGCGNPVGEGSHAAQKLKKRKRAPAPFLPYCGAVMPPPRGAKELLQGNNRLCPAQGVVIIPQLNNLKGEDTSLPVIK